MTDQNWQNNPANPQSSGPFPVNPTPTVPDLPQAAVPPQMSGYPQQYEQQAPGPLEGQAHARYIHNRTSSDSFKNTEFSNPDVLGDPQTTPDYVPLSMNLVEDTEVKEEKKGNGAFQPIPVITDKKNGGGFNPFGIIGGIFGAFFGFIRMIKNLLYSLLIIIIFLFFASVLILIYRPPVLWNPIKTFVNNGLERPQAASMVTTDNVYDKINRIGLEDGRVYLSEEDMTVLVREATMLSEQCYIDLEQDSMHFNFNVDTAERPLWFRVVTTINATDRLEVTRAGFGRFDLPQPVSGLFNDTVGAVFDFVEKQVTADSTLAALKQVLEEERISPELQLERVELQEGNVVLFFLRRPQANQNQ